MPKYLDPKNDVAFKKVFIENKDLMISFLNALLPLPQDCEIIDLQYEPPELLPETALLKDSFVDVRCFDSKGRHFIVEMQTYWKKAFLNRLLFKSAKVYTRELEQGDDYELLRPVYCLAILNDVMDKKHTHYCHRYRMTEESHPNETIDGIDITLIELPLFKPASETGKKMKDLWIMFLKETDGKTTDETIPQILRENELTAKALELCKKGAYSDAELAGYDKYVESIFFQRMEIAEGRTEGRAEGERETNIKNAKKMKTKGIDVNTIAEITGLTIENIEKL